MTEHASPSASAPHITGPAPQPTRTLRRVLLIVGSVVLAVVLVVTVVRVAFALTREDSSGVSAVSESFERITVESSAANIDIRYADVVQAEVRFRQGDSNLGAELTVVGAELRITVKAHSWAWWGADFPVWGWGDGAELELVLPETLRDRGLDFELESTAGNVSIDGDFGDVELRSTAGNLQLAGSASSLDLETTAGDTRLSDYRIDGALRSESTAGNGHYDLRTLPASISVSSTAGNVLVGLPDGSYRIETESVVGNVQQQVSSDQDSDRVYRFSTAAGNIDVNRR